MTYKKSRIYLEVIEDNRRYPLFDKVPKKKKTILQKENFKWRKKGDYSLWTVERYMLVIPFWKTEIQRNERRKREKNL